MQYSLIPVSPVEIENHDTDVFDLQVEGDHSYHANGVIVHNCSTRIKTGVGYPQLSAVIECADSAHGLGGHIIADGGISCAGDLAKAFGAGADFAMLGSLLAGHEESEQPIIRAADGDFVEFYGMSSEVAQKKHGEGMKDYRASEGRVVRVPHKGSVDRTVQDLLGGLRSCCSYVGARTLKELPKRTTFVLVSQQVSALYGLGKV